MRSDIFFLICLAASAALYAGAAALGNDYVFFAGYVVLQYVVLSTAWNILGGYCGYVNFGSAAFFALGAYSTVAMVRAQQPGAGEIDTQSERRDWHRLLEMDGHGMNEPHDRLVADAERDEPQNDGAGERRQFAELTCAE